MKFLGRDKAFMERVTKLHEGDVGSILAAIETYWDVDSATSTDILDCWMGQSSTEDVEPTDCGFLPCNCCDEYHFPMNKRTEPTEPTEVAAKQAPGEPEVAYYDGVPLTKVERFQILTTRLADTYRRKNADYGDSFGRSVEKYGVIAALTRMSDKWNRLENLILKRTDGLVGDESVLDTLMDLAAYALMTFIELEEKG